MQVTIVSRAADATYWADATQAFDAIVESCASYTDWAFRLRSGGEPGTYRLEAFALDGSRASGWVREDR